MGIKYSSEDDRASETKHPIFSKGGGGHKQRRCKIHIKQSKEGKNIPSEQIFCGKVRLSGMLVGNGFIFPQLFCPLKLINKSQILERKKINHCGRDAIFFPLICQCENFSRKKIIFQQYYDKGSFQRGGNPPPKKNIKFCNKNADNL